VDEDFKRAVKEYARENNISILKATKHLARIMRGRRKKSLFDFKVLK